MPSLSLFRLALTCEFSKPSLLIEGKELPATLRLRFPKEPPPAFAQTRVLVTTAVLVSKSTSVHFSAKYSLGRIPVARANANPNPLNCTLD